MDNYQTLKTLINELEDLQYAKELLQACWSQLGPYSNALTMPLLIEMQNYFKFDDSE